ncbi:uncharacterized protein SCHCODRAFT_02642505 [Schizophyllum commune H4-8]|uniref:uncharacterized protein n=1 Tax=Schizophyllum commune (strain H4-8 / FGSC 9210) TaxID=578458 RepID=UPI00215EE967|nr:uncharacterized protein SCHCODRAFT_02642505 [Schizophyllum commune H4-8]KAI5885775.1 hypothetical protein SCHCODRAFT_02642505 [Schizophyllum commune H4-8]
MDSNAPAPRPTPAADGGGRACLEMAVVCTREAALCIRRHRWREYITRSFSLPELFYAPRLTPLVSLSAVRGQWLPYFPSVCMRSTILMSRAHIRPFEPSPHTPPFPSHPHLTRLPSPTPSPHTPPFPR